MAHHNIATSGASQNNVSLSLVNVYHQIAPPATAVAVAQDFGSPLDNRKTYRPVEELIRAVNGAELAPRRYHGSNIYDGETGAIIDMQGGIRSIPMGDLTSARNSEAPTSLGTMIICLSVAMGKAELCHVVASAVMIVAHGHVDESLRGDFNILQAKIEKYATAVLSRDSMCNKRENTIKAVHRNLKAKFPAMPTHSLFLPPRSQAEYGDFAECLAQIMTARADGMKLYTRSVKLMGVALLLGHYGWQVDVCVEVDDDSEPISIEDGLGVLSLIYCPSGRDDRDYIESHARYTIHPVQSFWPTLSCKAGQMSSPSSFHFSAAHAEQTAFLESYNHVRNAWSASNPYRIKILRQGTIAAHLQAGASLSDLFPIGREDQHATWILQQFSAHSSPDIPIVQIIIGSVIAIRPSFDWEPMHRVLEKMDRSSLSDKGVVFRSPSNLAVTLTEEKIVPRDEDLNSIVIGAILGIVDEMTGLLVHLPNDRDVRVPAGESIKQLVSYSFYYIEELFDQKRGLSPGDAVVICAARLAGVNMGDLRLANRPSPETAVGYWNGQQGVILTTVFQRSLYWDLPKDKRRPLTLHNTPIIGIPTDDGGWIRPATVDHPIGRKQQHFASTLPSPCKVVMQYRPCFEFDSTAVVAAVYLDNVFYDLMPLTETLIRSHCHPSYEPESICEHLGTSSNVAQQPSRYLALKDLDPGIRIIPEIDEDLVVIGPQADSTSRFFTYLLYQEYEPIVQNGCMNCAKALSAKNKTQFIIAGTGLSDS